MKRYILYGLIIESEVELMQLESADDRLESADVIIRQDDCSQEVLDYLKKAETGKRKYEIGLDYSCFWNIGGYYVIKEGKEIVFEPREGYAAQDLSAWLLGFAFAMLLLQKKTLAIHCSAVCKENAAGEKEAFLVSGNSGAGKSTLTRKLLEDGYKLMADDVAAVRCEDSAVVYPAFPYQKLCRNEVEGRGFDESELIYIDEDKDKFLVPVKELYEASSTKLKAMFFLNVTNCDSVQVKKLSGMEQYMALRHNIFLGVLKGPWLNYPEVIELSMKLAGNCPVYLISRPAKGDSVGEIADIVENLDI